MNAIKKFLDKVPQKDAEHISFVITLLLNKKFSGLNITKIVGTEFYRVRVEKYRIIYFFDSSQEVQIIAIRNRDEGTYKNL